MEYCCEQMNFHIHEREKIIACEVKKREFAIQVEGCRQQKINFCPWCGQKLTKNRMQEEVGSSLESLQFPRSIKTCPFKLEVQQSF
ncbi:MAG: hypothetical protein K0S74_1523 [Chlamydiales bacterium]|jgi:hypothetical protein|nr:hypothetical protein [Chlamydiales bacterium]